MSNAHGRLAYLHSLNAHCHWCGVETWLPKAGSTKMNGGPYGRMATRDHIVSRNESTDNRRGGGVVLACHSCNSRRAEEANKATPLELRQRRSNPWKFGYTSLRHALAIDPDFLKGEVRG